MALSRKVKRSDRQSPDSSSEQEKAVDPSVDQPIQSTVKVHESLVTELQATFEVLDDQNSFFSEYSIQLKSKEQEAEILICVLLSAMKHLVFVLNKAKSIREEELMVAVHDSLSFMLFLFSGADVPSRRSFLNEIADVVNDHFSNFRFISPEQTVLIDPRIHQAEGISSQEILEGKTYAVIHNETLKTIKYAEIIEK